MSRLGWLVLSGACVLGVGAARADTVIMTARGAKGEIKGGLTQKGREGAMQCLQFETEVSAPVDVASGRATGKRQHKPIRCAKRVDSASTQLLNALLKGEALPEVTFKVFAADRAGRELQTYTIALKNASITGIKQSLDASGALIEEVTLVYASITYTWEDGKTSATDTR